MGCPVKTKEYKDLEELFGEDGALSAWKLNGEKTPATPEDAFKLLHPDGTTIDKDLRAWETPEFGGKSQKEYEPIMDKIILDNPNAPLGKGGESYNQAGNRAISVGERILDTAPDKSLVVLNSSMLKFIILNEKLGRMPTAKEYLDLHTKPGEQVVLKGKNGNVTFVRHGMTDENKDKLVRSEDAVLEDEGKTEADKIGQKLSKDQIPMTYVSPLVRTLQTADRILMKQEPKSDIYYSKDSRFGNGGTPYGNELPEQYQSFSHITDVVDRMNAIRDKKNELKQQGAIITSDNGSQLKWTNNNFKLNSDVTDTGKITNVNFPFGEVEQENYNKDSTETAVNLLQDNRVLLMRGDNFYSPSKSSLQLGTESSKRIEDSWRAIMGDSPDSSRIQTLMGKSFNEVFRAGKQGDKVAEFFIGHYIASRLLQKSDNYSGRLLNKLSKDGMVASTYVRLENDPTRNFSYFDGEAVYVNISKLPIEIQKYDSSEEFKKGIDVILSEEVTHAVASGVATDNEIQRVYDELTPEELSEFRQLYTIKDLTNNEIAHEYIRMLIQNDIFGTSTANEVRPAEKEILTKSLDYLVKTFKNSPTRVSQIIIKRIKEFIDSTRSNINYQKLNNKSYEQEVGMGDIQSYSEGRDTRYSNGLSDLSGKEEGGRSNIRRSNWSREENGGSQRTTENGSVRGYRVNSTINYNRSSGRNDRTLQESLDNKITKGFLKSVGANIQHISDTGQDYVALADTVNGIIQVVNGRSGIETLAHEATHLMLDLLPDNSKLLADIMRDVKLRDEYDEVYDRYKDDPAYHNVDGSINEDKIAKETASHIIDDIIVDKFQDAKALKWWERLWNYIKNLFRGKALDSFHQVAEDVLNDNTSKLSKEKLHKMKEANSRGEIYYELSDKQKELIEKGNEKATPVERGAIKDFVTDNDMTLGGDGYKKASDPSIDFTRVSEAVRGEYTEDVHSINREVGIDFHAIMQDRILGITSLDKVSETPSMTPEVRGMAWTVANQIYRNIYTNGSLLLPEIILSDLNRKVAGTADVIKVFADDSWKIIDFKTSKHSVFTNPPTDVSKAGIPKDSYIEKTYPMRVGSWLGGSLSANLQHGIQFGCYERMAQKTGGFNQLPDDSESHHIHIEFDDDHNVKNITYEGFITHPADANREYVDKIMGENTFTGMSAPPASDIDETTKSIPVVNKTVSLEPHLRHMTDVLTKQYSKPLDELKVGLTPSQLKAVTSRISNLTDVGEQKRAMNVVMNYMQRRAVVFDKFINDPKSIQGDGYYPALTDCIKLVNSNLQLLPDFLRSILDTAHQEKFDRLREKFNQLNVDVNIQTSAFIEKRGGDNNPFINQTEWKEIAYRNELDSSSTGVGLSPTAHLANRTLQHMDIVHKAADMKGRAEADEIHQELQDIAKRTEAGIGRSIVDSDFDKFYRKSANGKPGNQLLIREGSEYREIYENLQSALIDKEGEPIKSIEGNTPEIIAHNLELQPKKDAMTQFRLPETLSADGKMESGRYHHLSDEYIHNREQVMDNHISYNSEGAATYNEWVPKPGKEWNGSKELADSYFGEDNWEFVEKTKDLRLKYEGTTDKPVIYKHGERLPGERDPAYLEFRDNYQQWAEYLRMTKDSKGKPTGIVVKDNGFFADSAHIEMNDFDTKTGKDLRDADWKNLQGVDKPLDEQGKAWLRLYNDYIRVMSNAAGEMGDDWNLALKNGGLLILSNKFYKSSSDDNTLANAKHNMTELWGRVPKNSIVTDVQGVAKMQFRRIPLNNARNEKEVTRLKQELIDLNAKKVAMTASAYKTARKELTDALNNEEHKTALKDREMNLIKCAIAYCMAAKGIKTKREIEGQMQALTDLLSGKILEHPNNPQTPGTYKPGSNVQHQKTKLGWTGTRKGVVDVNGNPVYVQPHDAWTNKKAQQILRQLYEVVPDFGPLGKAISTVMQWTSGITMSNPFTNFKNAVLYQVMNSRAAFVSMYYPGRYYAKAFGLFHTDYLPGMMKKIGEATNKYGDKKPGSFMEAIMNFYQIGTKDRLKLEGASSGKWKDYLFLGEIMNIRCAEFSNIGGLMIASQIKNSITGEMVNAYDQAHDYNSATGEMKLKPGIDPEDMKRIILKGRAIQVENQGNYEKLDQPLIKEYQIGLPLMQFKNFLPSAANKRVGGRTNSLIFGPREGSWRTPANFIHLFNDASGSFSDKGKEAWSSLRPDQKINMRLAGLDLLYLGAFFILGKLLTSLAQGISSEDDKEKRWANLMASIANTIRFENQMYTPGVGVVQLAEFMENPIAMATTLKSLAEAVYLTTEWPFQDEDDRNYQNGQFKGTSKAAYQWEKFGLRPLAKYRQSLVENQVGIWK